MAESEAIIKARASGFYVPSVEEIRECRGNWAFCDGGLLISNPSQIGGTWAWCAVRDGQRIWGGSGVLEAKEVIPITNNVMELLAMCHLLAKLPDGWDGTIVSDSKVTLYRRLHTVEKMMEGGVPERLAVRARALFDRYVERRDVRWTFIDGHPTAKHLATGAGKRGNRVSGWNAWCDARCNEEKAAYFAGKEELVK